MPNMIIRPILLVVIATLIISTADAQRPSRFRVVSYNVLVGFQDHRVGDPYLPGAERKEKILSFLAEQAPDDLPEANANSIGTKENTAAVIDIAIEIFSVNPIPSHGRLTKINSFMICPPSRGYIGRRFNRPQNKLILNKKYRVL